MKSIKIGVSEDHLIYRNGLVNMLNSYAHCEVIADAENGKKLIKLIKKNVPDVVILDYMTPEMNGIQTAEKIRKLFPAVKILILSMFNSNEFIVKSIKSGVNGYLLKDDDPSEIILAIESVISTGYYLNDHTSKILINQLMNDGTVQPHFESEEIVFLDIELQIIDLICREYSTSEMASQLFKSDRTIDGYRAKIMKKIGAKNVIGIVMYAVKHNLIIID